MQVWRTVLAVMIAVPLLVGVWPTQNTPKAEAATARPRKLLLIPGICAVLSGGCRRNDPTTARLVGDENDTDFRMMPLATQGRVQETFGPLMNYLGSTGSYPSRDIYAFNYSPQWRSHPDWYYNQDSWQSLEASKSVLSDYIRAIRADQGNGVIIDIVGHSMGGTVAAYWAATEQDRSNLAAVRSITTLSSPLAGLPGGIITLFGALALCGAGLGTTCIAVLEDLLQSSVITSIRQSTNRLDIATFGNTRERLVPALFAYLSGSWRGETWNAGCDGITDISCHGRLLVGNDSLSRIANNLSAGGLLVWPLRQVSPSLSSLQNNSGQQIAIGAPLSLAVRLLDGYGQPVAGKRVSLTTHHFAAPGTVDAMAAAPGYAILGNCCIVTDINGNAGFILSSVVPGLTDIRAYVADDGDLEVGRTLTVTFFTPAPTPAPPPPPIAAPVATPAPQPPPAAQPPTSGGYRLYAGGEGGNEAADFKFSIGKRSDTDFDGWMIHAPRTGGQFVASRFVRMDGGNGVVSIWGQTSAPNDDRQFPFNLVARENSYEFRVYQRDGTLAVAHEGPLLGGSVRVFAP